LPKSSTSKQNFSPAAKGKTIAATVVLYHPDQTAIDNIGSYLEEVSLLLAMDNSETPKKDFVELLHKACGEKLIYKHLPENPGLAVALNMAACEAMKRRHSWLLTMDQDSRADKGMVEIMCRYIEHQGNGRIGIVSPFIRHSNDPAILPSPEPVEEPLMVMTSGNLLNLEAFREVGSFREELFLDYVDYEYCLRLRRAGYRIVQVNSAVLQHQLGNMRRHRLLWKRPFVTHHSVLRRYYITRNRFFVNKIYGEDFPEFSRHEVKAFWQELLLILLFERDRVQKLIAVIRGFCDYHRGILGKTYMTG